MDSPEEIAVMLAALAALTGIEPPSREDAEALNDEMGPERLLMHAAVAAAGVEAMEAEATALALPGSRLAARLIGKCITMSRQIVDVAADCNETLEGHMRAKAIADGERAEALALAKRATKAERIQAFAQLHAMVLFLKAAREVIQNVMETSEGEKGIIFAYKLGHLQSSLVFGLQEERRKEAQGQEPSPEDIDRRIADLIERSIKK